MTAYVHRSTLPQSRFRSTAPSGREPGRGAYHSTCRPETAELRAIFIAPTKLKNRFLLPFIVVHSLSLAFARQLPQRGSREGAGAIHRAARKPEGCGRFSSPLRNSKTVSFYHSSGDTPSVSFADSSLREGAGNGVRAIQRAAQKPQGCGRFSSPLRNSECFTFYHSTDDTPSVSLRSTAPSGREPGWGGCRSTYRPESARLRAIFIAPTEL